MKFIRGLSEFREDAPRVFTNPDPDELMEEEDEKNFKLGVLYAPTLKKAPLTGKQKFLAKVALAVVASLVIAIPTLSSQLKMAQDLRHQAQVERAEGEKIEMRGEVSAFEQEGKTVYAIVKKKNQEYRILIPEKYVGDVAIGDQVDFTYTDGFVPKTTLEQIIQGPR